MKTPLAIALLLLAFVCRASPIHVWDALPALEPHHLQGAFVGTRVCPICRHGYDAGILVFVPASTNIAKASQLKQSLAPTALARNDSRFRVFIIVTGEPSSSLLASLHTEDPRWYVASVSGDSLAAAKRDFGPHIETTLHAYVFSQRRSIRALSQHAVLDPGNDSKQEAVVYAQRFLESMQPVSARETAPKADQSAMWFAPSRLTSSVGEKHPAQETKQTCFIVEDAPLRSALARVTYRTSSQIEWARTDVSGCLNLPSQGEAAHVTFYRVGAAELQTSIEPTSGKVVRVSSLTSSREPVVGIPCEGCEDVFLDMPSTIGTRSRIGTIDEPGERLLLTGRVFDASGTPAAGIIVYAYQTAANGRYPPSVDATGRSKTMHGRLRGWSRTDATGHYAFDTIRPGGYPGRRDPQHIHMHIIEPGRCTYYIGSVLFDDDPRLTTDERNKENAVRGGAGIVTPHERDGTWAASRDIQLGKNVTSYAECDRIA